MGRKCQQAILQPFPIPVDVRTGEGGTKKRPPKEAPGTVERCNPSNGVDQ